MRVSSLEYNPVYQANNKQQNTPVFKGTVSVIIDKKIKDPKAVKEFVEYMLEPLKTVFGIKGIAAKKCNKNTLKFDAKDNQQVKAIVDTLNKQLPAYKYKD